MRGLLALPLLALLVASLPGAVALNCSGPTAGLAVCAYNGATYKEKSVTFDDPALASVGVREVWFQGFVGTDTTYEAYAFTAPDSPVGQNGAAVRYRCLQFNGGPECTLMVLGAGATLAGLGGPTVFAGYQRDFFAQGYWCVILDGEPQACQPAPPLRPLPAL